MGGGIIVWALLIGCLSVVLVVPSASSLSKSSKRNSCGPLVLAHRGASGYVPEHTLGAYALAITMGTDYVEPDLVMTQDGHLVSRHENELGISTNVAQHPEFANRFRIKVIDGGPVIGWFTEDFTLAELKTLRAREVYQNIRPGNTRMDDSFEIPTLQEIIDLVKGMEISERRTIGICPEIKHGSYFQRIGLAMEQPLVNTLHSNGYRGFDAPILIQSFEVSNLQELKNMTDLRLVQLYGSSAGQPPDQAALGTGLTYGYMATPAGLRDVAQYAFAAGPAKNYIIPRTAANNLGAATSFVQDAHEAGLEVHPYTFRAENNFLPNEFRSPDPSQAAIGNFSGELIPFYATGIDGLFTDHPDIAVRVRGAC